MTPRDRTDRVLAGLSLAGLALWLWLDAMLTVLERTGAWP
jgi:hypothetical protein